MPPMPTVVAMAKVSAAIATVVRLSDAVTERIGSRVRAARPVGSGKRRAALEQSRQQCDRVPEVESTVVVRVLRVQTD